MPAATLPITDQHPRVEYVVTTPANDTFAVPFPLPTDYAQALHVTINGAETTLYTYTPDSEVSGGYPTGVVVLDTAVSNSTVVIFRLNDLDRDTDYGVGPFDYAGINAEFAKTAMRLQDLRLKSAMIWHTGTGAPADATVGLPGDMYIDESTGDVYGPKDFDDTWPASTFSLQGPAGADGTGDMSAATYDPAAIAEQLVGLTATQSLTNKTLTTPTLTLKQSAAPTPTAEGDIQWDTDDNTLKIGDGAATKTFSDDSKVFLLANNLSDGVAATMRTNLSLVPGVDVMAYDADLADIAGITPSQGDIIYRNATNWVRLAAGSSGQFLKTLGAGANPIWDTVPGGGDMLAATYDPAAISQQLVGISATQTLTNKTLTTPTLTLKQGTAPTPTAEGDIQWDTDDNTIVVGDGAGQKTFLDGSKVFQIANNLSEGTAATMRTNLGLVPGVDVQSYDAGLAWLDTLNFTNESTFKAAVNLEPGVDVQGYDADLNAIAGLTFAQGDVIYRNATQLTNLAAGTSGFVLQTQGAAANPTWARMYGTEQIWVPACAMKPRTTNGCADLATTELATNKVNVETLDFDAAAIEYAQFTLRLPKRYATSTFTATFYWKHAATATNFGVVWGCQAQAFGDGESFESAWGTAQEVTDTGGNTSYQYISSATSAITIANLTAQENVYFQVYRNATSGSDNLAIDAGLVGVLLTFTATQNSDD